MGAGLSGQKPGQQLSGQEARPAAKRTDEAGRPIGQELSSQQGLQEPLGASDLIRAIEKRWLSFTERLLEPPTEPGRSEMADITGWRLTNCEHGLKEA